MTLLSGLGCDGGKVPPSTRRPLLQLQLPVRSCLPPPDAQSWSFMARTSAVRTVPYPALNSISDGHVVIVGDCMTVRRSTPRRDAARRPGWFHALCRPAGTITKPQAPRRWDIWSTKTEHEKVSKPRATGIIINIVQCCVMLS